MEESNHPLGMKVFEIQDTVAGHKSLTEAVIQRLMTAEDFSPLPPNLQRRVFGHMIPTPSWLVAEVSGAAIIVTNQWVVSIYGDSLFHCIAALVKYRNAVATVLVTSVTGEVQTPVAENTGPLSEVVTLRERKGRFKTNVRRVGWVLVGAALSGLLTMIANVL